MCNNIPCSIFERNNNMAKVLMGAGIGVGIAHALGKNKLLIFSAVSLPAFNRFAIITT